MSRLYSTNCYENVKFANLSEPSVQLSFNKMLQRLAVTNPKNDKMDHGLITEMMSFAVNSATK